MRFPPLKALLSRLKALQLDPPPLAWAQLSHQKVRFIVAIIGVCFANILMFTQLGLLAMLNEGTTILHENLSGDLLLISTYSPSLQYLRFDFPLTYLHQAAAVEGVAIASPLYLNRADWTNPQQINKNSADPPANAQTNVYGNDVRILAFNPTQPVFKFPEINQQLNKISMPDSVLFDRLSQASLGRIPDLLSQQAEVVGLMDNQRVYVVGLFNMGSTMREKGNVVMSDWNYANRYGADRLNRVNVGVLKLSPEADPKAVQERLRASLPSEVTALTPQELMQREHQFQGSQPEGVVLQFGTVVGFVVGMIVLYQVLYADINDHLSEYATLKAMGYSDFSLLKVVLQEAIVLAIFGFIPGFLGSLGIYHLLVTLTRIPLEMRYPVAFQVFILTLVMCGVSGVIASSKLRSADPVDVF